ncbi:flagellar protein FlaG [Oceanobacillus piezotolerans]|uniref:Flagellar protein FlaG n=1 Tax=Oceanobacillus piezotolerans TaxID=2448030 RepID=A0A498DA87_9BACI|nr:flagellar protein FlaG [Oceanobacillus piezotolerans]RLL46654.1 flagellar protein FlaG [Oceanobacillus piezotolerans]
MAIDKVSTGSEPPLIVEDIKRITSHTEKAGDLNQVSKEEKAQYPTNENVTKEALQGAVASLNEFIKPIRTNLKFELHERLERYYVSVVDSETKEVVKEIPPKKMLDMYAEMAEFMGFLIDEKI